MLKVGYAEDGPLAPFGDLIATFDGIDHNVPQEVPEVIVEADRLWALPEAANAAHVSRTGQRQARKWAEVFPPELRPAALIISEDGFV